MKEAKGEANERTIFHKRLGEKKDSHHDYIYVQYNKSFSVSDFCSVSFTPRSYRECMTESAVIGLPLGKNKSQRHREVHSRRKKGFDFEYADV